MKEKEITVLKVSPLEKPCVCTLFNKLEELQKAVSLEAEHTGLIEIIEIGSELGYQGERVCLLCNEEGKLKILLSCKACHHCLRHTTQQKTALHS